MATMIRNPFKNHGMRQAFDACVETYLDGGFRNQEGTQNRGGSHKVSFWNGYNNVRDCYTLPNSLGWACKRAGEACAKHDRANNIKAPPQQQQHVRQKVCA